VLFAFRAAWMSDPGESRTPVHAGWSVGVVVGGAVGVVVGGAVVAVVGGAVVAVVAVVVVVVVVVVVESTTRVPASVLVVALSWTAAAIV